MSPFGGAVSQKAFKASGGDSGAGRADQKKNIPFSRRTTGRGSSWVRRQTEQHFPKTGEKAS